jgi:hypothetical protein
MPWKEKLYERSLKRPIDEATKAAIQAEFRRRQDQIPMPTVLTWNTSKSEFSIRSRWISFIVHFTAQRMVVSTELSAAAKMFATKENRGHAIRFIESVANDLNL